MYNEEFVVCVVDWLAEAKQIWIFNPENYSLSLSLSKQNDNAWIAFDKYFSMRTADAWCE